MPYAINLNSKRVIFNRALLNNSVPFVITFEIESKTNINIEVGQEVVLLDVISNELMFTHFGYVTNKVSPIRNDENRESFNTFKITVNITKKLETDNDLNTLAYSLSKVYRFKNKKIHFIRSYIKFSKKDFEAITESKIDIPRTAFGTLANAMHIEHKKNFLKFFMTEYPDVFFTKKKLYSVTYPILREYIQMHILKPYRYLEESYKILPELCGRESLVNIGFSEPSNEGEPDLIKEQIDSVTRLSQEISEGENERYNDIYLLNAINENLISETKEKPFKENSKTPNWLIDL